MPKRVTQTKTVERRQRVIQYVTVKKEIVQCEPLYVRLGEVIAARRLKLGITQGELADRVGLARTSICNIEIGRQRVLLGDLWSIAAALEMSPRSLFNQLEG
jgi:DNA-binding XRE family transcriptional regulator